MRATRLASPALFAVVLACFSLPFLDVAIDAREAHARGFELASGTTRVEGRYVHAAYEGEVERAVRRGRWPAATALVAALAGLVLSPFGGWKGARFALAAASVVVLGLLALRQTPSSYLGPATDFRYGFALALVFSLFAVAWSVVRVRDERRHRDDAPVPMWDRLPR
ncbi:MAG: hypothetical protein M3312_10785 [Actinomycetota bacterium]|nr:hypothetical protein [Actinomycetota bacterium]